MSDTLIGLALCGLSSIFFGSMFVPVKHFNTYDGVFVQWCMCMAIYFVGLIAFFVRGLPSFQPFAMLGGMLWTIGNLTAIPIIQRISLGLGVLIWGTVNCVVGWGTSRFGLFGLQKVEPSSVLANYIGVLMVLIGGVLFSYIKTVDPQPRRISIDDVDHEEASQLRTTYQATSPVQRPLTHLESTTRSG